MALLLMAALPACATGAGGLDSGIAGKVVAGPTCPVERVPPDPRCEPRPLSARLEVRLAGSAGAWRTVRSASNGRFRVKLAPGAYVVRPLSVGRALPRPPAPLHVRVRAGHFTFVRITYDTGIR